MSDKRLELHKLNYGFLIEYLDQYNDWSLTKFDCFWRNETKCKIRPALEIEHFNNGSMVLCDGLVVEVEFRSFNDVDDGNRIKAVTFTENEEPMLRCSNYFGNMLFANYGELTEDVIMVKILGVTPEYAEHGKELGMGVAVL